MKGDSMSVTYGAAENVAAIAYGMKGMTNRAGLTFYGSMRVVVPPAVANAIARQRDALTAKNRKSGAQQAAATREARGIKPTFKKKAKS